MHRSYTLLLSEAAVLLDQHGDLLCAPEIEMDGKEIVVTLRLSTAVVPSYIPDVAHDNARKQAMALNLYHAMEFLRDTATARAIANRWDIPSESLEQFIGMKTKGEGE